MADQVKKHYLAEAEEEMLKTWEQEQIFEQSVKNREGQERFSFYDGPPYANGLPHHGHAVQSILKDSVTRYKTMRGYYVPRRTGWDCHGLPIEYKIEQELGFKSKADILDYGIEKFNQACRESVFTYVKEWNQFFDRIGRWRDKDNQYATMETPYIESVWWAFAQIYKQGLVYEDFRSTPYCPRCATPLSNFEVNQGYQDNVKDPSLFVKFQLKGDERKLLAWTTTPWSLPGNAAIAVHPGELYVTVKVQNDEGQEERLILAEKLLAVLNQEYEVEGEMSGQELVGLEYDPLFALDPKTFDLSSPNLYKVWAADFVSVEDGSGVLHVAPAFGEDDLSLGKANDLPVFTTIDPNGKVTEGIGFDEATGVFFKAADEVLTAHLAKQGKVFAAETISHTYPFCWRCDTPLLYYATKTWFIKVSEFRDKLLTNNQQITWIPDHIRDGRFGKWLEGTRDWAFSRNRFWGAPLPIWKTEDGEVIVVESVEELKSLGVEAGELEDLHRPYIDNVVVKTKDGKEAYRVEEVFDVWFESGSMPYAQDHYPFENKQWVEAGYPADFIAEAQDQTRGWFYSLHVIASALFDKPAFQHCITTGWVNAADGQKLSKRKKNYTPLDDLFDMFGADPLRFFMMTSPIVHGEDIRFSTDFLKEVQRNVFMTLQNTFNFYKTYRDIDQWQPPKVLEEPTSDHLLDRWMVARLNQTTEEMTKWADKYEIDKAVRPLSELLDDLSNWFVRRSRRRFWKSEDDADKAQAYATLHYTLVRVCQLMAPWAPFMSDRLYRQLTEGMDMPASVHLTDWPVSQGFDVSLVQQMASVRGYIAEGLAQRAAAKVKVRQPLSEVTMPQAVSHFEDIIKEELNVKTVLYHDKGAGEPSELVSVNTTVTDELALEGVMRDVIRQVQAARKQAGLEVDDRIRLYVHSEHGQVAQAIAQHWQTISSEVLATEQAHTPDLAHKIVVKIVGADLTIALEKA